MNTYPEGQIVSIVIPFKNLNGDDIVPNSITAVLLDGEDSVIAEYDVIFDPQGVETSIIIPGSINMMTTDDIHELRRLSITISDANSTWVVSKSYSLEAEQTLRVAENSFQSLDQAELTANNFFGLTTFSNASSDRRAAALVEAFRRITRLYFRWAVTDSENRVTGEGRIHPNSWDDIDADTFRTSLPSSFRRALREAQVLEANEILLANPSTKKRILGIVSETVGESSVTFSEGLTGNGVNISPEALEVLRRYIDTNIRIGRV